MPLSTAAIATRRSFRREITLSMFTIEIMSWRPIAWSTAGASALLITSTRSALPLRLTLASTAVAATAGFALEDPASCTLAGAPTSLAVRRVRRTMLVMLVAGAWWTAAVQFSIVRIGGFALIGKSLLFATLVVLALVAAAVAPRTDGANGGGIAGAVVALCALATTYLPPTRWLPLPSSPDEPGAAVRLAAVICVALTVLAISSRDPASRRLAHTP